MVKTLLLFATCSVGIVSTADDANGVRFAIESAMTNRTVDVQSYQALKAENEALRKENQRLRRELVARNGNKEESAIPQKVEEIETPAVTEDKDTGFWLSSKSHIRHNPKCRNYRKVKGAPCGPDDGKPCKACGG